VRSGGAFFISRRWQITGIPTIRPGQSGVKK